MYLLAKDENCLQEAKIHIVMKLIAPVNYTTPTALSGKLNVDMPCAQIIITRYKKEAYRPSV